MKSKLAKNCAALLVVVVGLIIHPLYAQSAPPPSAPTGPGNLGGPGGIGGPGGHHDLVRFLTQEQRNQLREDREAALAANPDLKTQEQTLLQQGKALRDNPNATAEDKADFRQSRMAFEKIVNDAAVKINPSLQPVLDEIAQHFKEARQTGNNVPSAPPEN